MPMIERRVGILALAYLAALVGPSHAFAEGQLQVSEKTMPDGLCQFTVKNTSGVFLTAIVVRQVDYPLNPSRSSSTHLFYDSFLNPHQRALVPGESYTFGLGPGVPGFSPARSIEAAIFSDGTAVGDVDGIRSLCKRHLWTVKAHEMALDDFDFLAAKQIGRQSLVETFQERASERNPPGLPREQRDALRYAYSDVLWNINGNPNVPPEKVYQTIERP